ncbi:MAG: YdcF family protein [Clostridiales bacterium]|nr:YdcF family protein [Clostridiales bacterium]
MKKHQTRIVRKILMGLSVLLALWCAIPMFTGIIGVGSLLPMAALAVLFMVLWKWPSFCQGVQKLWRSIGGKVLIVVSSAAIVTAVAVFCTISGLMISAFSSAPQGDTVIVLGAKTINGEPMLMLANRLDAAAEYLEEHPQAICVVTGGQGDDEVEPEAVSMQRYLMRKGISEQRIYVEDQSTNTSENLQYATDILETENLSKKVVIVTDEFHQYRAQHFARECGLEVSAKPSSTPWYMLGCYWVREIGGVLKALLLGY